MVLRQGMGLTALGIGIGIAMAAASAQLFSGLLFDVAPTDFPTYLTVVLTVLAVSGLANWIPARRAAGVDPITALREE